MSIDNNLEDQAHRMSPDETPGRTLPDRKFTNVEHAHNPQEVNEEWHGRRRRLGIAAGGALALAIIGGAYVAANDSDYNQAVYQQKLEQKSPDQNSPYFKILTDSQPTQNNK